jgi:N-methylhydantoinase A
MSSFGLLTAPPAFERMRTVKSLLRDSTQEAISEIVGEMEEEVLGILDAPRSDVEFRYIAEMWHHGQEYPIEVPFDPQDIGAELITTLRERFSQRYRELYGRVDDETPIEIANVRVIGGRPDQKVETVRASRVEATRVRGIRRVYEPRDKAFVEVQVLDRAALRPGEEIDGPIVIQERESGIVVRRGDRVRVHESGAVFVELECARA